MGWHEISTLCRQIRWSWWFTLWYIVPLLGGLWLGSRFGYDDGYKDGKMDTRIRMDRARKWYESQ